MMLEQQNLTRTCRSFFKAKNIFDEISNYSSKNNLIIGITHASPLLNAKEFLKKTDTPFVDKDTEKRINPKKTMEKAKSIIIVGMAYGKKLDFEIDNKIRTVLSVSAIGQDYHTKLKNHLDYIAQKILSVEKFDYKIFVDTGYLLERELARRAGLGFFGKNNNIISEKFGSFINLGYIITDLNLEDYIKNEIVENNFCENCNLCTENCPSKALSSERASCDFRRCVSYLSQKKDTLTNEEIGFMKNTLYGCDICQNVCPLNKDKHIEIVSDINIVMPVSETLINMTKQEFNRMFKETSAGWRGKNILIRNAVISLGNSKEERAFEILKALNKDEKLNYYVKYFLNT